MINLKISVNLLEKIFNKINPFELAMICKEWLKDNEFNISSGFNSENSKVKNNDNLKCRVYKTGLSLIKGENNKYTFIPQSKIIDTELN